MNDELYKNDLYSYTKTAAYFLWEFTNCDNALQLWRCVEDIAFYAERHNILSVEQIQALLLKGRHSYEYSDLIRNIAYRIYLYTGNNDSKKNWYTAEKLIFNMEWSVAVTGIATLFNSFRNKEACANKIYSDVIKRYYKN